MLRISKLADYAIVIMHCLSRQPQIVRSANDIAKQVHLTHPTVSKILKILFEAGLVISIRGAGGGYKLAKLPEAISLAEVISALEGAPSLTECGQTASICAQDGVCAIKHNWQVINRFILNALTNVTLADMAKPLAIGSGRLLSS